MVLPHLKSDLGGLFCFHAVPAQTFEQAEFLRPKRELQRIVSARKSLPRLQ
jgi:hypothetical protein